MLEILARTEPLERLPSTALAYLAAAGWPRIFGPGEPLLVQGAPCTGLHVILRGRVAIERSHPLIDEPLRLAEAGPADIVGELGLFDGGPSPETVRALEPTETLELTPAAVAAALLRSPDFGAALLPHFSRRLRSLGELALTARHFGWA